MILMYRAVTGWLKILEVLSVLDHVVGRKKRVVPLAVLAETKSEVVSEYCTSISVANCCHSKVLRHCVTTPWTLKLLPKSICIHAPAVFVFDDHACAESSIDRPWPTPA
jgi:hypothetical protein